MIDYTGDKTVVWSKVYIRGDYMNFIKKIATRIFIDGLTGMAHGLFATLIIGTIIQQI